MEWLKKLGAAIDYVEDHLDKEISYDEAARIACCSPYYFQRIFSYVSGVSLAEYHITEDRGSGMYRFCICRGRQDDIRQK